MLLLTIVIGLPIAAILANRAPLTDAPGIGERLKIYLLTNRAETRDGHSFPELRTPHFEIRPDQAKEIAKTAARKLGWDALSEDAPLHFVATTSIMRFKDDVRVEIRPSANGVTLKIISQSRVGRGDFAANAAHITEFIDQFTRLVSK